MLKANLGYKKIKEDTENFSLEGMIEPTFYNFGPDPVSVLHSVIPPGEAFNAGVIGMVMMNEVPIVFEGNNVNERNLIVYYGTLIQNC